MTFGYTGLGFVDLVGDGTDLLGEASLSVQEWGGDCEMGEDPETGEPTEECWFEDGELLAEDHELGGVDGADLAVVLRREDPGLSLLDLADLDRDGEAELLTVRAGGAVPAGGADADGDTDGEFGVVAEHLDGSTLWSLPAGTWPSGLLTTPTGFDVLVDEAEATVVRAGADLTLRWSVPA